MFFSVILFTGGSEPTSTQWDNNSISRSFDESNLNMVSTPRSVQEISEGSEASSPREKSVGEGRPATVTLRRFSTDSKVSDGRSTPPVVPNIFSNISALSSSGREVLLQQNSNLRGHFLPNIQESPVHPEQKEQE
jgi:hypothetical protein